MARKFCISCKSSIPVDATKCHVCTEYQGETKACVDCLKLIPNEAKRCPQCLAYQSGIRRNLNFSSTVLSLLVALTVVIGTLLNSYISWKNDRTIVHLNLNDNQRGVSAIDIRSSSIFFAGDALTNLDIFEYPSDFNPIVFFDTALYEGDRIEIYDRIILYRFALSGTIENSGDRNGTIADAAIDLEFSPAAFVERIRKEIDDHERILGHFFEMPETNFKYSIKGLENEIIPAKSHINFRDTIEFLVHDAFLFPKSKTIFARPYNLLESSFLIDSIGGTLKIYIPNRTVDEHYMKLEYSAIVTPKINTKRVKTSDHPLSIRDIQVLSKYYPSEHDYSNFELDSLYNKQLLNIKEVLRKVR